MATSLLAPVHQMHQYQQAFVQQQQLRQHQLHVQQQLHQPRQHPSQQPFVSSPPEFQLPLSSFSPAGPVTRMSPGPVALSPVEPPYTNSRTSLVDVKDSPTTPQPHSATPQSHPPDMSRWNPFGEDNFSKLTEEELLDREFDLLRSSKPVERTASQEIDRPLQPISSTAKPLLPEDLFGSTPFLASAGKS